MSFGIVSFDHDNELGNFLLMVGMKEKKTCAV
jgi:hypothetical protein